MKPLFFTVLVTAVITFACTGAGDNPLSAEKPLQSDWKMQPSDKLSGIDEKSISENGFDVGDWYNAVVPGTVLGSMVTYGVLDDPYFGINMLQIDPEQFKHPWWFRTSFSLTADEIRKTVSLRFNGINYRADLWVNGKKVAVKEEFAGTYRMFTYNISGFVNEGQNTVALKLWQYADGEYSIGFVDWNPWPPDRNMGIFRDVILEINDGVKIRSPYVYSKVNSATGTGADIYIQAEVINSSNREVEGTLEADFELGIVRKKVKVGPGETVTCNFSPEDFAELSVENARLWWPNGMGSPDLYNLKVDFISGNEVLDRVRKKYGIREVRSYLDERKNRVFEINGRFVLLKGAAWTDDLFLMDTPESVEAQLRYVKHMNLNSIRCEGFWGKDETIYDLCDEYGIMVMIGWSCQWEWEEYLLKPVHEKYGGPVTPDDISLIAAYWFDQMMWLRNHPSIYVWMLGSDILPHPDLERKYAEMFKKYDPARPVVYSAAGVGTDEADVVTEVTIVSEISGPTGMKMLGPYAITPPVYWFTDTIRGGAYGFNTETCPGEAIPPLASLKKMLPAESLWPIDKKYWEFHTGRNEFVTLSRFIKSLNARYGESSGIEEFSFKSQVSNYELMRPMFEAFIAHKPVSTGIVQWKLNSAWPDLIWQLFDSYLQPSGSFYGTRKACTPLHAIYRYGFNDIYLANEDLNDAERITVRLRVFDINSKEIFSDKWEGNISSNTSKFIYKLPEPDNITPVWFLNLRVYGRDGRELDDNVYWLSEKRDILDYKAADKMPWAYYTPTSQYADFTSLNKLPGVQLETEYKFEKVGEFGVIDIKVKNPSGTIAFFVYFDPVDPAGGNPVLPVYWSDNYVTIFPGEERTYSARYFLKDATEGKPLLKIKGWNVKMLTLK